MAVVSDGTSTCLASAAVVSCALCHELASCSSIRSWTGSLCSSCKDSHVRTTSEQLSAGQRPTSDWTNLTRGLPEHCDRQALRLGMQPGTVGADPCRGPEPFNTVHHRPDCGVMTLGEAVVARQRPPHRQRLRCRQRRIEAGHRPHQATRRRHPIHERRPQRCPTVWVPAFEQGLQVPRS